MAHIHTHTHTHTHTEYWIKCVCLRRPVHSSIITVVSVNERWNSTRNHASLIIITLFLAFKLLTPLSTSLSATIPFTSPYLHSTAYKHAVNGVKHNELRKPTVWVNTYTNSDVSMYPQRISYSFMASICNEVRYYFLTGLNITEYFLHSLRNCTNKYATMGSNP